MPTIAPRYRAANGDVLADPLSGGGVPTINLKGVACLFTNPSILGEVTPENLWNEYRLEWPNPIPAPEAFGIREAFELAVDDLCHGHSTIAVQTSGGLDSLAVLYTACRLFPDRTIVAVCADVTDDNGVSTLSVVRSLIANLALRCDLQVIQKGHWTCWPKWSVHGPYRTASPEAHLAMVESSKYAGATILLSGDGSDELLAAHRFCTLAIAREKGFRESLQYLRDAKHTGPGMTGELLAAFTSFLPSSLRLKMYWAINWPEWCEPRVAEIVSPRFRGNAREWANDWLKEALRSHVINRRSWCEAEAFDAWWPQPYFPPASDIAEGSPYMHEGFVPVALAQPLSSKYSSAAITEYHRFKHLVVELFDEEHREVLPRTKQYFTKLAAEIDDVPLRTPFAIDLGLFDAAAIQRERDTATKKLALSVERWLAGARDAGVGFSA